MRVATVLAQGVPTSLLSPTLFSLRRLTVPTIGANNEGMYLKLHTLGAAKTNLDHSKTKIHAW